MNSFQVTFFEIISLFRRRKVFLIIPIVIVSTISTIGAFLLPKSYESSTTILYQRDETTTPILGLEIRSSLGAEDRLNMYREILSSRTILQRLLDSLGLNEIAATEKDRQALIASHAKKFDIENKGSGTFTISYTDDEAFRAQQAVRVLTNLLIQTISQVQTQQNDQSVQFFENKLKETREKFEESQRKIITHIGNRVSTLPEQSRIQYTQIENLDRQINDLDTRLNVYQQAINILQSVSNPPRIDKYKESLYDLTRMDIPFATDLSVLLKKYDDFLQRYTSQYPEVKSAENQISELLIRMQNALESDIGKKKPQRIELENKRAQLLENVQQTFISGHLNAEQESDFNIYRKLYDDMKVRLEQAKSSRDLGYKTGHQFIILDPPLLPTTATKPKKMQLILAGFGIGIFLGFISVIMRELFDTTVRTHRDIEIYQKPIIAYISDGNDQRT